MAVLDPTTQDKLHTIYQLAGNLFAGRLDPAVWQSYCLSLRNYLATFQKDETITLKHEDRLWEVVSAYQKAIRRSDHEVAMKVVKAVDSKPEHYGYLWRRVVTTACEDIGPANLELVNFVVICAMEFTPKKYPQYQYQVLSCLTTLMVNSTKCRTWCNLSILSDKLEHVYAATGEFQHRVWNMLKDASDPASWFQQKEDHPSWNDKELLDPYRKWVIRNDWRGEKMLRYQMFDSLMIIHESDEGQNAPLYSPETLFGLPEYAYDMHTRAGQKALARLCVFDPVKKFLTKFPPADNKMKLLGWCVFLLEGGRFNPGIKNAELMSLEKNTYFRSYGYATDKANHLMMMVHHAMMEGVLTQYRLDVLKSLYPH